MNKYLITTFYFENNVIWLKTNFIILFKLIYVKAFRVLRICFEFFFSSINFAVGAQCFPCFGHKFLTCSIPKGNKKKISLHSASIWCSYATGCDGASKERVYRGA